MTQMMTKETWLPVVGYEGLYDVSDLGQVRSLPHLTRAGMRGGKILAQSLSTAGRPQVSLYRDGKGTSRPVHRLVLEAFRGPCPPGKESRHGPGGMLDNRLVNLFWGTHSQNMLDKSRDGTSSRGEQNGYAKLTPEAVLNIRARAAAHEGQRSIARAHHITQVNVSMIVRRKTWAHIP